ncbi:cytochrome c-type biogenesis protein [Limnohabitans sp. Rim47]|uniref:cytochrome c-type biogenesis protein n=1 Tax=Limnohabitans sp. Rim47 TaxID=1100721 RepID=UPI000377C875|nr:cytochrome c-type biogenesis protein [Limnohabitans sp. Rim47]
MKSARMICLGVVLAWFQTQAFCASGVQPGLPAASEVRSPALPVRPSVLPAVLVGESARAEAPMSPQAQARWDHIATELRCMVCQNESLASSNAELAVDLRRELRHLIEQGQSDADIRTFLVSRYGDFVLYKPVLKPMTWLLWFSPFALLLLALAVALRLVRRTPTATTPLTERERERVRQLLES